MRPSPAPIRRGAPVSAAAPLRRPRGLALVAPGLAGPELALVALADWLFWHRFPGLSLPLFCVAVAAVAAMMRPARRGWGPWAIATLLLAAAVAPAVERLTPLSAAFAVAGTLLSVRLGTRAADGRWPRRIRAAALDIAGGPGQLVRDLLRRRGLVARRRSFRPERPLPWLAWIAPVVLTAAFAALLAGANPLIAGWIAGLPLPSVDDVLHILPRSLFWLAVLAATWPMVRYRRRMPGAVEPRVVVPNADARELDRLAALLLSPAAVLRVLVLLDLIIGLQIGLDGAYLWGGLALPDGLTYAAYAHRGAYPLVATALLAGGVALAIRRPGAPPPSGFAAALLPLFLAENVVLVISAMERLGLYVAAYALTEWRVAAFAWMGLVALGLVLIAAQGVLGRDGRWLLRANVFAGLAVLYGWCFLDVPRFVADYDVAHCAEMKGEGPSLDVDAVVALGPEAVPALDRYLLGFRPDIQHVAASHWRGRLAAEARADRADWRGWSLAGWRLARYLDMSGVAEPATPPAGDDGS